MIYETYEYLNNNKNLCFRLEKNKNKTLIYERNQNSLQPFLENVVFEFQIKRIEKY
jgi:hypothetical protein